MKNKLKSTKRHIILFIFGLFIWLNNPVFADIKSEIQLAEKPAVDIINAHFFNNSYNYMKDSKFINALKKTGKLLLKSESAEFKGGCGTHFTIGDLDGDKIPELVVYEQRTLSKVTDPGYLVVYSFDGIGYNVKAKISMNFDNTCIGIAVGKISKTKSAIFVNNSVGLHTGMTYLFALDGTKLHDVLQQRYVDKVSVYPKSQFKDIDNDGICEFSIFSMDPESADQSMVNSDKIYYWYKWDGKSGGKLVKFVRTKKVTQSKASQTFVAEFNKMIKTEADINKIYAYLKTNQAKISKSDVSQAIDKIMQYENKYSMEIDYQFFLNEYSKYNTNEMNKYLKIMGTYQLNPIEFYSFTALPWNQIARRISEIDTFKRIFPYSRYSNQVDKLRKSYENFYFNGNSENHIYDTKTMIVLPDVRTSYENSMKLYIYEPFYDDVAQFYDKLKKNQFKFIVNPPKKPAAAFAGGGGGGRTIESYDEE